MAESKKVMNVKILIAGASGGVGSYLINHFDREDFELFLTYKDTIDFYHPKKAKFKVMQCDFSHEDDVKDLFDNLSELDVLINTMGTVDNAIVTKMSLKAWDEVLKSNLTTVFLSCRQALPKMLKNSHIINISSVLGTTGLIGASNYVAAKGGVEAFTRSLAQEALREKVFVNAVALGYFDIGLGLKLTEKQRNKVLENIPLGEFGDPSEIGAVIDYIIKSKYLVGQTIHLNGGLRI